MVGRVKLRLRGQFRWFRRQRKEVLGHRICRLQLAVLFKSFGPSASGLRGVEPVLRLHRSAKIIRGS